MLSELQEEQLTLKSKNLGKCIACKTTTELINFHKNKNTITGHQFECKKCVKVKSKKYYQKEKDKYIDRAKIYYQENKEKALNYSREYNKEYSKKPEGRFRHNIVKCIRNQVSTLNITKKYEDIIGCSVKNLRKYFELQFSPGMTWENYGYGEDKWTIDHIVPISAFNLINKNHLEWCWNYKNLRPLWFKDNLKKSSKIKDIGQKLEELGITTAENYLESLKIYIDFIILD